VLLALYLVTSSYYASWYIFFTTTWANKPKQDNTNMN
jgi:hypothetical protein